MIATLMSITLSACSPEIDASDDLVSQHDGDEELEAGLMASSDKIVLSRAGFAAQVQKGGSLSAPLVVSNRGATPLAWLMRADDAPVDGSGPKERGGGWSWLRTSAMSGEIPAGGSQVVTVTMDSTNAQTMVHKGVLDITSNDASQPFIRLRVLFTVLAVGEFNDAEFVSQSVNSAPMGAGASRLVAVTMKNIGNTIWRESSMHRLGTPTINHNPIWGFSRVFLGADEAVAPGALKTFYFRITSPITPGVYDFQWRMVQAGIWFGKPTPSVPIKVTATGGSVWVAY
jgi:hypothetical protein